MQSLWLNPIKEIISHSSSHAHPPLIPKHVSAVALINIQECQMCPILFIVVFFFDITGQFGDKTDEHKGREKVEQDVIKPRSILSALAHESLQINWTQT